MALQPPAPIGPHQDASIFDCGRPELDDWLRRRALRNQQIGVSRSYVVCDEARIVGYYSLAAGAVARSDAPRRLRRNAPDALPVMVLGRLAVDRGWQGQGLGASLLRDAVLRTLNAAEIAGIRALLVQAIDGNAASFYRANGFLAAPIDPLILMLPLESAQDALGG